MNDARRLRETLATVAGLETSYRRLGDIAPTADSAAAEDGLLPIGLFVRSVSVAAMSSALDHLVAWGHLFSDAKVLPAHAHMTLLRSAVEGASLARWHIDPTVASAERISRAVGVELRELGDVARIESLDPDGSARGWTSGLGPATDRRAYLEHASARAGIRPVRITRTDAVTRYGIGELDYKILCAFAHGSAETPQSASLKGPSASVDEDRLQPVDYESDIGLAADMTAKATDLVEIAAREVLEYHGQSWCR